MLHPLLISHLCLFRLCQKRTQISIELRDEVADTFLHALYKRLVLQGIERLLRDKFQPLRSHISHLRLHALQRGFVQHLQFWIGMQPFDSRPIERFLGLHEVAEIK